ncbi:hypothetical protein K474DRAFT_1708592 [Panus rudis PR-1116 ss-1]|nr:hypothetical protein K474DRAFT_1708592 [Panus rudis PR-1116 ss-1]
MLNLRQWTHFPTKRALDIVRNIVAANPEPLTTHELWKLVVREEAPQHGTSIKVDHTQATSTEPPYPSHEIRSISYLKHTVLPELMRRDELKKVHTVRTLTQEEIEQRLKNLSKHARQASKLTTTTDVWKWQRKTPAPPPAPRPEPEVFGKEVGVGEDWSHLNKRRRRAREEKVERDVQWMRALEKARLAGLKAQQKQAEA